jgi:hypothetical protein
VVTNALDKLVNARDRQTTPPRLLARLERAGGKRLVCRNCGRPREPLDERSLKHPAIACAACGGDMVEVVR